MQPTKINALKKISYQYKKEYDVASLSDQEKVDKASSLLDALVVAEDTILGSQMPTSILGVALNWNEGTYDGDAIVGLTSGAVNQVEDMADDPELEPFTGSQEPIAAPITRLELDAMIANGDDVTGVNTSEITDMSLLFYVNSSFNQDISGWDVSSVTNMNKMFQGATSFNQDISGWDVSNVTSMVEVFFGAGSFDQDISTWDISKVTNMENMFLQSNLSMANYDAILNGWANIDAGETQIPSGITFGAGTTQYSQTGRAAHDLLTGTYGWNITDGGLFLELVP